ncbi:hypothetical protein [Deinococcus marmoris]|uniref:Uncharacterized protein n=1 Tax=Deinococcus marmoris TaxID=249408 RepID=A0A1U7NR91_9DEIO|nr:hypothetical protein [Deinococcus marmoris]OLV15443.1 hypothetical protein BOO71_0014902 [Deinococcus marmoris]
MKRPLLVAAALYLAVSGGALASHQTANLKPFRTVCITGDFTDQSEENSAVLDELLGNMVSVLDDAGITVADNCRTENGGAGRTQLNLYFTFSTTKSGTVFSTALEGWLQKDGPYTDVTLWRDSYFGSIEAGQGAEAAAEELEYLLEDFIEDWDSAH